MSFEELAEQEDRLAREAHAFAESAQAKVREYILSGNRDTAAWWRDRVVVWKRAAKQHTDRAAQSRRCAKD